MRLHYRFTVPKTRLTTGFSLWFSLEPSAFECLPERFDTSVSLFGLVLELLDLGGSQIKVAKLFFGLDWVVWSLNPDWVFLWWDVDFPYWAWCRLWIDRSFLLLCVFRYPVLYRRISLILDVLRRSFHSRVIPQFLDICAHQHIKVLTENFVLMWGSVQYGIVQERMDVFVLFVVVYSEAHVSIHERVQFLNHDRRGELATNLDCNGANGGTTIDSC